MIPEEKARERALKTSNPELLVKIFIVLIAAAGLAIGLAGYAAGEHDILVWAVLGDTAVILLSVFSIKAASKFRNTKTDKSDKSGILQNPVSKSVLMQKAVHDPVFGEFNLIETNGDWLDFTYVWRQAVDSRGNMIVLSTYKKLVRLDDDGTYQELDYFDDHYSRRYSLGHSIYFEDMHEAGCQTRKIDTVYLTNIIHKWLSKNGYRKGNNK